MSQAKNKRVPKRQKGQFLTPRHLALDVLSDIEFKKTDRVLEPGFGDGSFLLPLIEVFLELYEGPIPSRLEHILNNNVWGVEIDPVMYDKALSNIEERIGPLPASHNLILGDYFETTFDSNTLRSDFVSGSFRYSLDFTHVIGNPPFGGTIAPYLQDSLDKVLGWRHGIKIKKETYAWFIIKSMDLLADDGILRFICSDTFLTIYTMRGLRNALALEGQSTVWPLNKFSEETSYPMVVLDWVKTSSADHVLIDGDPIPITDIERTANLSWGLSRDMVPYFQGPVLGEFMVATSGMTTGNNSLFIREVRDNVIAEPYEFTFEEAPITLGKEMQRARLGHLSVQKRKQIKELEKQGKTRRELKPIRLPVPNIIELPNKDYLPYNKANGSLVYSRPTHYIYWKDDGDAVITYKKTGNWYLHGIGGAKYFGREGLTWRLISSTLDVRYLPTGYILDSGAPCAFPRPGVSQEEMLFIMGWTLTDKCTRILKQVINHTMNIQGKDFERLPYPFWVGNDERSEVISLVMCMLDDGFDGRQFSRQDPEFDDLESLFRMI